MHSLTALFPFAGSKRKTAKLIDSFLPKQIDAYAEPFAGSLGVMIHLANTGRLDNAAVKILDADRELIMLYEALTRGDVATLLGDAQAAVDRIQTDVVRYIQLRAEWNDTPEHARNVGTQLALRTLTFNGLWRHNRQGGLNVPPRDRLDGHLLPTLEEAEAWHRFLAAQQAWQSEPLAEPWNIRTWAAGAPDALTQWLDGLTCPRENTVVYLDPPYFSKFTQYLAEDFDESDQIATLKLAAFLADRGYFVAYSNAYNVALRKRVIDHWPKSYQHRVEVDRVIAADALARGAEGELLITSSEP